MIDRDRIVNYFPVASSVLIESGQCGQLYRMWTQHTAAGQNVWGYVSILVALVLWCFYHRRNKAKTALYVTMLSCVILMAVIVTILVI